MGCGASSASAPGAGAGADEQSPQKKSAFLDDNRQRRDSYQSPEMQNAVAGAVASLKLDPRKIGTFSNHGIKPGQHGRATAKINQDRGIITYPLAYNPNMAMLCVYDGHGTNGDSVRQSPAPSVPARTPPHQRRPPRARTHTPDPAGARARASRHLQVSQFCMMKVPDLVEDEAHVRQPASRPPRPGASAHTPLRRLIAEAEDGRGR
jgi:hypothetical protein